ncbi:DUF3861 domain-containing protein [Shewanella inventionis]|uniref:DUF3861 family protein n=1 Tax=Shewanella inventionis TaxID=1738770 RepID=A0ABQ1JBX6_9GAMM|nr:DUF3861 domain-containing protein [Shewanella inventionis]MCL1157957.1 DUF3861 domain-containing protein [Shewanella inventionis]UAL44099.1 DUF3861 domain-containing protein [Shewanella inventionis]GGB62493.1 hypothetical protein GCM10011607_24010 [Shewanella inventionis]
MSKDNQYRITVEHLDDTQQCLQQLQFEFQDREDLFKLVENLKIGSELPDREAARLSVALRLLGPLMIQNRKHPIFVEFMPHFKTFMQNLKTTIKSALITNQNK